MENNVAKDAEKLIEVIEEYVALGKTMMNDLSGIEYDAYYKQTIVHILDRLIHNSISVKLIIGELFENGRIKLEHSIGILLRNCSSDIITLTYISDLVKTKSFDEVEIAVRGMLANEILFAVKKYDPNTEDNKIICETDEERKALEEKYLLVKTNTAASTQSFLN